MGDAMSKERPIIFSAPMVRALLEGRKTMTRRVVKPQPPLERWGINKPWECSVFEVDGKHYRCPYGSPGDRLWVKESFWKPPFITSGMLRDGADTWPEYVYCADPDGNDEQWKEWGWMKKPSIHMPRWASRITLEITGVKVERVQDISYDDCSREGIPDCIMPPGTPCSICSKPGDLCRIGFKGLWESIHGPGSWERNDWCWVIEFRRLP